MLTFLEIKYILTHSPNNNYVLIIFKNTISTCKMQIDNIHLLSKRLLMIIVQN